ncbi:hypothetical protein RCO27_16580 [Sphingosinicella sp. LHD-64]|uniref:hypothetical protein n=1 Tax=Sphingosinicella sp. LHD-64 TaxID=3072139 RepID=UPI00280EEEE7|nr:hypothetical protein [Sphingosinicella sp. LHD-64]MDQ8757844.1 hypothetical protein [Sphingosinicella sp. LHD-64]
MRRIDVRARRAADQRRADLARQMAADAPGDVTVQVEDQGIVMSGRGLRRRTALDPALRWIVETRR